MRCIIRKNSIAFALNELEIQEHKDYDQRVVLIQIDIEFHK